MGNIEKSQIYHGSLQSYPKKDTMNRVVRKNQRMIMHQDLLPRKKAKLPLKKCHSLEKLFTKTIFRTTVSLIPSSFMMTGILEHLPKNLPRKNLPLKKAKKSLARKKHQ